MHRETGDAEPRVREEESKWERERGRESKTEREREWNKGGMERGGGTLQPELTARKTKCQQYFRQSLSH